MKNIAFISILTLLVATPIFGQQTIDQQFEDLLKKSNNYQEYKVVKKEKIYTLRKNILDSISKFEETIQTSTSKIEQQNSSITALNTNLEQTKKELTVSKGKENGIVVLGMLTNKTTYTLIVFITLAILIFIIVVLFIKYKSSFAIIKTTKSKLVETDEEFENFRQRSLEREQQIRRKLQDEINKNK